MHMTNIHHGGDDEDILRRALEDFERRIAHQPAEIRNRVSLILASRLCEKIAFSNAGEWAAVSVADLLLLSAQIERFTLKDQKLD